MNQRNTDQALEYRRAFGELGSWQAVAQQFGTTAKQAQKCWYNAHYRHGITDPVTEPQPFRTSIQESEHSTFVDEAQPNVIHLTTPEAPATRYDISDPLYDIPDDTHRWHKHLSELPSPLRLVFWTDAHIGKVAGHLTHDPRAIELSLKPMQDFKPHVVVVGSDMFEFDSISRFSSDFDRLAADALKEVEKPYMNIMADLRSAAPDALFPFLVGNHDWRLDEHSRSSQYRYTVIHDFVSMLRAGRALWLGWRNVAMEVRSLRVLHGRFSNKYAANKHGDFYGWDKDMVFGHTHRFDYAFRGQRQAWNCGCLANVSPHWQRYPTHWQQGVIFATVYDDHTQFTPLLFRNYHTVFGEKEYKA